MNVKLLGFDIYVKAIICCYIICRNLLLNPEVIISLTQTKIISEKGK